MAPWRRYGTLVSPQPPDSLLLTHLCLLGQLNLSNNRLCGVSERGNYKAEGINAIADALRVNCGLTALNLSNNYLKDEGVNAVCEAIQSNKETKLASLNFKDSGIGPGGVNAVAAMVAVTGGLTSLNLSSNDIGSYWDDDQKTRVFTPVGPKAIADALLVNGGLTALNLSSNNLEDLGISAVCYAIQSNKMTKLASLNFERNRIGPVGANAVAAMVAVTGALTSLDLSYNKLGDSKWTSHQTDDGHVYYHNNSTDESTWTPPAEGLCPGILALAHALHVNGSLTRVDVRHNNIVDGATQLSAAVLGNIKIEMFNEIPIKKMRANSLTELDLKGKGVGVEEGIGVEGCMVVGGLIPVMGGLTSINLSGNHLCGNWTDWRGQHSTYTAEGITAIADALRVNGALTQVLAF
jgi:hypothetical protein